MEVDEIQTPQPRKFSRVNSNNGRFNSSKIDNNEDGSTAATTTATAAATGGGGGGEVVGVNNRLRQWQHSSRIIRVSRASGGKDRHSKVWTAKGPRDRRVRLSVTTAIQFYDLQDRLGYDQPSKAVEWLINAAADAINELPSLNHTYYPPETPRQANDERRTGGNIVDSTDGSELKIDPSFTQNQLGSLSKSGSISSNNSETSKGSGLSLSRSESRVKARERARERTAKDKGRENELELEPQTQPTRVHVGHNNMSSMPHTSSFTQLLTAGISNNLNNNNNVAPNSSTPSGRGTTSTPHHQWWSQVSTTPMDHFSTTTGLIGPSSARPNNQFHLGNEHHEVLQHQNFPFVSDQQMIQGASGSDYNLNFTMSSSNHTSGLATTTAGFNRGTLQSNSPSLLPPYGLQRFSSTDGSSVPFFLGGGGAAVSSTTAAVESQHHHHHHHHQQFLPPWQSDQQKGKGKN